MLTAGNLNHHLCSQGLRSERRCPETTQGRGKALPQNTADNDQPVWAVDNMGFYVLEPMVGDIRHCVAKVACVSGKIVIIVVVLGIIKYSYRYPLSTSTHI